MTANEVTELLTALRAGSLSIDAVAERFRHRVWARTRQPLPVDYLEFARRAESDPEPDVPGSYDDVVAAFDRGEITQQEYDVLSEAVAASFRAHGDEGQGAF